MTFRDVKTSLNLASILTNVKMFWYRLQSLDRQNYGSWPRTIKTGVIILVLILVLLLGYLLLISSQLAQIKALKHQQQVLMDNQRAIESKVNGVKSSKLETDKINHSLRALIDPLSRPNHMSALMESMNTIATNAGVELQDVSTGAETSHAVQDSFDQRLTTNNTQHSNQGSEQRMSQDSDDIGNQNRYIEQPVRMVLTGDYHEFGIFFMHLVKLSHLMTLQDFSISPHALYDPSNTEDIGSNNVSQLSLTLQAKVSYFTKIEDQQQLSSPINLATED